MLVTLILMGGDLRHVLRHPRRRSSSAAAFAATIIRFPFSAIIHGLPIGHEIRLHDAQLHPRELIDEITKIAEIVRKQGPMALEKHEVDDPFLAKGIRFIADGYDRDFIRARWNATATTS